MTGLELPTSGIGATAVSTEPQPLPTVFYILFFRHRFGQKPTFVKFALKETVAGPYSERGLLNLY